MALSRWTGWLVCGCVLAGNAASPLAIAEQTQRVPTLQPDDELGPIQELPQPKAHKVSEWQPRTARVAKPLSASAPHSDALAPPMVDLPAGTDAPPQEADHPQAGSQRKGMSRKVNDPATADRKLLKPKAGRTPPAGEKTGESPVNIDIPGFNGPESPILEAPTKDENLGGTPENPTPQRRPFMSRFRASGAMPPASETPGAAKPVRGGWGIFRGQPTPR